MEPGIGRAIKEGFRAANKSWAGIGVFAGGWLLILLLVVLVVAVTNPPTEALQQQQAVEEDATAPNLLEATAPAPTAEEPEALTADGAALAPASEGASDVLIPATGAADTAAPPADQADAVTPPAPTGEQRAAETARVIGDWLGRAWPLLTLCLLLVIAGSIWLSGGQIGYVAKRVQAQQATVADFVSAGTRSFGPLLGGSGLWIAAVGLLVVAAVVIALALGALGKVLPGWLLGVLAVLLVLAALGALVWVGIRLAFWFIAVVVDQMGPVAGLTASFRAVRGRWWRVAGLIVLMGLISSGAWIVAGLIETIGNAIGGGAAVAFGVVANSLGVIANLYVSFATIAACVRFYEDTKSPTSSTPA